ncbi:MAG: retroviral-like aspartic protease family protein [Treponema sp.]|jgi:clan AA aspartic protease|nr:retroviral-like aspartic protease family protein [Treponema sp.]
MSIIYTEITLKNTTDAGMAERGLIKEAEVRQTTVNALVDTGAWTLVINEAIRAQLGLKIREHSDATVAGGKVEECDITEPVTVCWQDRETECRAVVLPEEEDVLLGAYPLKGMDLVIHPGLETIIGAHGGKVYYMVK